VKHYLACLEHTADVRQAEPAAQAKGNLLLQHLDTAYPALPGNCLKLGKGALKTVTPINAHFLTPLLHEFDMRRRRTYAKAADLTPLAV
jgi:hypothetical protein